MGLLYRLRQLRDNLTAGPLSEPARRTVSAILSPAEEKLFYQFSPADQWHGYHVLCDLCDAGYNDPALLAAALLHDVGKSRYPLSPWDRTVVVIGSALLPGRAKVWGEGPPVGWRRPFVVRARHPEWGAAMAGEAGSRGPVVELIRRHQDKQVSAAPGDELLRALQWADDRN